MVRHLVAISVAIDGDSTRDAIESGHLFGCAKLMWFFFIFFLPFFLIFLSLFYRIIEYVYILLYFGIWNNCQVWVGVYIVFSLHINTFCSLNEWGPIPGSELLRIKGDCVAVSRWMYFPSGHYENPS